MIRYIKLVLLLVVSLGALSAAGAFIIKPKSAVGIFDYLFFDGPYTSRTIRYDKIVLEPETDLFKSAVSSPDFEDPHWFSIDLNSLKSKLQRKEDSTDIHNSYTVTMSQKLSLFKYYNLVP